MIRAGWSIHVAQEIPNKLHNFLVCFKEDGKTNQAIKSIKSDWTDAKSGQMKMIENRIVFFSEENVRQAGFIIAKYHVPINENFGKQI